MHTVYKKNIKKSKRREWTSYIFVIPSLIFVALFLFFPILYNFILSFKDVSLININGKQQFIGIQNYIDILNDKVFYISISNSLIFTIACIFFQFTIGFSLALYFNKKFPGRNIFRSLLLLGWMLPIVITGTVFKWMFSGDSGIINYILSLLGIINSDITWLTDESTALLSTIIANVWIGIPFNMLILLAGLQGLPKDLFEAAKIDGANRVRQFFHITLPLMKPTISILLMLVLIYTFKVFDLIYVMTGGGPVNSTTIFPLYAYQLAFNNYEISMGATASSIMFLLLFLIAFIYLFMMRKED